MHTVSVWTDVKFLDSSFYSVFRTPLVYNN